MVSSPPSHLLTLWNPSYAGAAVDDHLAILLRPRGEDEPYVWWAKLRSPNRQQPLPHAAEVLAIQDQVEREVETHLYLTDYRSLYVGWVEEITADDVPERHPGERDRMPAYYLRHRAVDFWFRLRDIRRLVSDETEGVIREVGRLRNVRYHGRPVSLYGGMVDLPLVVTREEEVAWFAETGSLLGGSLWAEYDARNRSETERLARDLRDNLLGPAVWEALDPATRSFLASGEATFRARSADPGFDCSGPALEYVKAVEAEVNALLFRALRPPLRGRPPSEREETIGGRRLDFGSHTARLDLGGLVEALKRSEVVRRVLPHALPQDHTWLRGEIVHQLDPLRELRNRAAHSGTVTREEVLTTREAVLGIGREGLICRLARARLRAGV